MRLAAADEDRSAAIAVTSRTATLLAAELLAGAGDVRALTGRTRRGATVDELPRHNAVQDVGARLDAEHFVVELDVAASLGVEGLNLDLHRLAFLALVGGRRFAFRFGVLSFCRFGFSLGCSFGLAGASFLLGRDRLHFLIAGKRRNFVDRRFVDEARRSVLDDNLGGILEQARRIRRALVARQLDRVLDGQPATLVSREPSP